LSLEVSSSESLRSHPIVSFCPEKFSPCRIAFIRLTPVTWLRASTISSRMPDFYDCATFGTLAPSFLASERPIAIACSRLFTMPPLPPFPERRVPFFSRRTALSTDLPAALPYLRLLDFLREPVLFPAAIHPPIHMFAARDPLPATRSYDALNKTCVAGENRPMTAFVPFRRIRAQPLPGRTAPQGDSSRLVGKREVKFS